MREILFRGKQTDYREWIYGGIVHQTDYYGEEIDEYRIIDGTYTEDNDIGYSYRVDPSTVGQYIGLTDKNGVKIFEGDIVRTKKYGKVIVHTNVHDFDVFKVQYEPCMFRLVNKTRCFNLVDDGFSKFEVIGNIHDNPELLKGGEGNG